MRKRKIQWASPFIVASVGIGIIELTIHFIVLLLILVVVELYFFSTMIQRRRC